MEPALSLVVAGSRALGVPPELEGALGADLKSGRVELLISTARTAGAVPGGARVLDHPPGTTLPRMRLGGVQAARAPLVAVTEDFCLPAPGWADALLSHPQRASAAAVGGPISRRGGAPAEWALTLIEYGRFFRADPEGWVDDLPAINVAYDAMALKQALGDEQEGLFETAVHARLREQGGRFWRAPGALMYDEDRRSLGDAARSQFQHGRLFGGRRVQGSGPATRLLRAGLTPAVPAALLSRIAREAAAGNQARELRRALPALGLLLCAWASGEAAGSLLGEGDSASHWT